MLSMDFSPTTSVQGLTQHSLATSPTSTLRGFKRSASTDDEHENGDGEPRPSSSRRNTAVKRACNECRQQKLKCNVQQDPFVSCNRCIKQNLRCVIEPNFKRVGKRNRNAEMEKEMEYLRERLALYEGPQALSGQPMLNAPRSTSDNHVFNNDSIPKTEDEAFLQTQHQQVAATSLLDLRSGSPMFYPLGSGEHHIRLSHSEVTDLFAEYFQLYHPFLPFLDQVRSPDEYYSQDHKLLFWAIISVAARRHNNRPSLLSDLAKPLTDLIWDSIRNQPNHHVVKALCLLCTWPIPAQRTVTDPTFILCGAMMQVAMQIGLHQPTHLQDFSRTKVRLRQEDINDRLRTWAVCNIVAQTVSTGNGQPSITIYNSTLDFDVDDEDDMRILPPTLFVRLRQEKAADRINDILHNTHKDRSDDEAIVYLNLQAERLRTERKAVDGVDTELEDLYHRAVSLHLHLYSFFVVDPRLERRDDLVALYFAATGFLDCVFKLHREGKLLFVPYYIMQMSLAAGFTLLKILNSDFAGRLPSDQGRKYVLQTVDVLRKSKVWPNDLLDRFAEVLAQLWKESSRGRSLHSMSQSPSVSNVPMSTFQQHNQQQHQQNQQSQQSQHQQHQRRDSNSIHDDPLGLIVRSRKSMSVVFDCVWRWREAQVSGAAEQLDNTVMTNPTNPDSSSSSTPPPGMVVENPAHSLPNFNPHLNTLSMPLQLPQGLASANSFEFFDSVSWMLDTQNDWNNYPSGGFGNDFGT